MDVDESFEVFMNKAILVIDMPKNCWECPLSENWEAIPSVEECHCILTNIDVDKFNKPDWCPLKQAPEEQEVWNDDDEWVKGYNNCVREILGREDYE